MIKARQKLEEKKKGGLDIFGDKLRDKGKVSFKPLCGVKMMRHWDMDNDDLSHLLSHSQLLHVALGPSATFRISTYRNPNPCSYLHLPPATRDYKAGLSVNARMSGRKEGGGGA